MQKILTAIFFLFGIGVATVALAHSYQQGDIQIGHIWARATAQGQTTAAVYVPLLNNGKEADRLVAATSPLADKIEIHQVMTDLNVAHMQKMDGIVLEPGKPVALRPGGTHMMLFGVKHQIKKGDTFPLTLQFEKAGSVQVEVQVAALGAMSGE